jgi:hypothetical protein
MNIEDFLIAAVTGTVSIFIVCNIVSYADSCELREKVLENGCLEWNETTGECEWFDGSPSIVDNFSLLRNGKFIDEGTAIGCIRYNKVTKKVQIAKHPAEGEDHDFQDYDR